MLHVIKNSGYAKNWMPDIRKCKASEWAYCTWTNTFTWLKTVHHRLIVHSFVYHLQDKIMPCIMQMDCILTQPSGHIYSVSSSVLKVFALSGQILSSSTINIVMHKKRYLILKFNFKAFSFYVFSKGLYWSPIAFIFHNILKKQVIMSGLKL